MISETSVFALKKLNSGHEQKFQLEVNSLQRFLVVPHPHIISLLMAYVADNQYYLVFHWAEADLKSFWETRKPKPFGDTMGWMMRQCLGLADALKTIHEPPRDLLAPTSKDEVSFRHGDLKHENILLFKDAPGDIGTLKVADFGLAKVHTQVSRSGTRAYSPPSGRGSVAEV
jgi:serine/threonine protein kinase